MAPAFGRQPASARSSNRKHISNTRHWDAQSPLLSTEFTQNRKRTTYHILALTTDIGIGLFVRKRPKWGVRDALSSHGTSFTDQGIWVPHGKTGQKHTAHLYSYSSRVNSTAAQQFSTRGVPLYVTSHKLYKMRNWIRYSLLSTVHCCRGRREESHDKIARKKQKLLFFLDISVSTSRASCAQQQEGSN